MPWQSSTAWKPPGREESERSTFTEYAITSGSLRRRITESRSGSQQVPRERICSAIVRSERWAHDTTQARNARAQRCRRVVGPRRVAEAAQARKARLAGSENHWDTPRPSSTLATSMKR